jgi:hypothetical protein
MLVCIRYSDTLDTIAEATSTSIYDLETQELLRLLVLSYFCDEFGHLHNRINRQILNRLKILGMQEHMLQPVCDTLAAETQLYLPNSPLFNIPQSCIKRTTKDTYTLYLNPPPRQ